MGNLIEVKVYSLKRETIMKENEQLRQKRKSCLENIKVYQKSIEFLKKRIRKIDNEINENQAEFENLGEILKQKI